MLTLPPSVRIHLAVEPVNLRMSFRGLSGLVRQRLQVITLMGQDGYDGSEIGLKPIGIIEDQGGYADLKPIGLETLDSGSVSLKPIGRDSSPIGLKPIGYGTVDSMGYVELGDMGDVNVQSDGTVDVPVSTSTRSTRDSTSSYTTYTTRSR